MLSGPFDRWNREETFGEFMQRRGITRRAFLRFCSRAALVLGGAGLAVGTGRKVLAREIAETLPGKKRPVAVWLQLQECTGCLESALRSGDKNLEDMLIDLVSLDYCELVMAAAGDQANSALAQALAQPHLLVVNGAIPLAEHGAYCVIGGESAEDLIKRAAENAVAILAVGACAHYGSVQAAHPNPTGAVGVDAVIRDKTVINVAGCPPIGEVITATILYFLVYGRAPSLDRDGRPAFGYSQRIHDKCPRRAHFDAGQFVNSFDDENARKGYCLYKVGCKGPATYAPCPVIEWNLGISFPIKAGHPCLGCTERHFYDRMTPFYERLPDLEVPGTSIEANANLVGGAVVGASLAGVAVHGVATMLARRRLRKPKPETVPLAIIGEKDESRRSDEEQQ